MTVRLAVSIGCASGIGPEVSVKPGLVQPQVGGHEAVWWDPRILNPPIEIKYGLRNIDILGGASNESAKPYDEWKKNRESAIEAGSAAQCEIVNPSEADDAPVGVPIHYVNVAPLGDRPGGRRFGTLVHMIIRDAGFASSRAEVLAKAHGRALGAELEEIDCAATAVRTGLLHPLLDRARQSERCYRELPVTLKLEENRIVDGSIDLAFLEAGSWKIVDFKTDAHVSTKRAQYERQLRWYAAAMTKLTGQPAECFLLSV